MRDYIQRYRLEFIAWWRAESELRERQSEGIEDREERDEIRNAPIDPDGLPQFSMARDGLRQVLVSSQTDLLLLLTFNVVFFMGAYMGFLRYDLME
jgi:hypothetical protein